MVIIEAIVQQLLTENITATVFGDSEGRRYFTGLKVTKKSLVRFGGGGSNPNEGDSVAWLHANVKYSLINGTVYITDVNEQICSFVLADSGLTETEIQNAINIVNGGTGGVNTVDLNLVGSNLSVTVNGVSDSEDLSSLAGGAAFAWYDTGLKTIRLYATANPTSWITETAVGTYTIVVPAGQRLERISWISTTAAGGSQNAPGGAINFLVDTSANGGNTGIADGMVVGVYGIDGNTNQGKYLGGTLAATTTFTTTFAANVATINIGGITGGFPDGSKMMIYNIDNI